MQNLISMNNFVEIIKLLNQIHLFRKKVLGMDTKSKQDFNKVTMWLE